MEDYEEQYRRYRSRYYDACDNVNACQRTIAAYQEQRRQTVNKINELNTNIKKICDAISDMKKVLNRQSNVTDQLAKVSKKVSLASDNYSSMVSSSDVSIKSLDNIFSSEAAKTKASIRNIFETVTTRKTNLENTLSEREAQLKNAKNELDNIDRCIRQTKSNLSDWKVYKTNNYYQMEYYKRKMEGAGW